MKGSLTRQLTRTKTSQAAPLWGDDWEALTTEETVTICVETAKKLASQDSTFQPAYSQLANISCNLANGAVAAADIIRSLGDRWMTAEGLTIVRFLIKKYPQAGTKLLYLALPWHDLPIFMRILWSLDERYKGTWGFAFDTRMQLASLSRETLRKRLQKDNRFLSDVCTELREILERAPHHSRAVAVFAQSLLQELVEKVSNKKFADGQLLQIIYNQWISPLLFRRQKPWLLTEPLIKLTQVLLSRQLVAGSIVSESLRQLASLRCSTAAEAIDGILQAQARRLPEVVAKSSMKKEIMRAVQALEWGIISIPENVLLRLEHPSRTALRVALTSCLLKAWEQEDFSRLIQVLQKSDAHAEILTTVLLETLDCLNDEALTDAAGLVDTVYARAPFTFLQQLGQYDRLRSIVMPRLARSEAFDVSAVAHLIYHGSCFDDAAIKWELLADAVSTVLAKPEHPCRYLAVEILLAARGLWQLEDLMRVWGTASWPWSSELPQLNRLSCCIIQFLINNTSPFAPGGLGGVDCLLPRLSKREREMLKAATEQLEASRENEGLAAIARWCLKCRVDNFAAVRDWLWPQLSLKQEAMINREILWAFAIWHWKDMDTCHEERLDQLCTFWQGHKLAAAMAQALLATDNPDACYCGLKLAELGGNPVTDELPDRLLVPVLLRSLISWRPLEDTLGLVHQALKRQPSEFWNARASVLLLLYRAACSPEVIRLVTSAPHPSHMSAATWVTVACASHAELEEALMMWPAIAGAMPDDIVAFSCLPWPIQTEVVDTLLSLPGGPKYCITNAVQSQGQLSTEAFELLISRSLQKVLDKTQKLEETLPLLSQLHGALKCGDVGAVQTRALGALLDCTLNLINTEVKQSWLEAEEISWDDTTVQATLELLRGLGAHPGLRTSIAGWLDTVAAGNLWAKSPVSWVLELLRSNCSSAGTLNAMDLEFVRSFFIWQGAIVGEKFLVEAVEVLTCPELIDQGIKLRIVDTVLELASQVLLRAIKAKVSLDRVTVSEWITRCVSKAVDDDNIHPGHLFDILGCLSELVSEFWHESAMPGLLQSMARRDDFLSDCAATALATNSARLVRACPKRWRCVIEAALARHRLPIVASIQQKFLEFHPELSVASSLSLIGYIQIEHNVNDSEARLDSWWKMAQDRTARVHKVLLGLAPPTFDGRALLLHAIHRVELEYWLQYRYVDQRRMFAMLTDLCRGAVKASQVGNLLRVFVTQELASLELEQAHGELAEEHLVLIAAMCTIIRDLFQRLGIPKSLATGRAISAGEHGWVLDLLAALVMTKESMGTWKYYGETLRVELDRFRVELLAPTLQSVFLAADLAVLPLIVTAEEDPTVARQLWRWLSAEVCALLHDEAASFIHTAKSHPRASEVLRNFAAQPASARRQEELFAVLGRLMESANEELANALFVFGSVWSLLGLDKAVIEKAWIPCVARYLDSFSADIERSTVVATVLLSLSLHRELLGTMASKLARLITHNNKTGRSENGIAGRCGVVLALQGDLLELNPEAMEVLIGDAEWRRIVASRQSPAAFWLHMQGLTTKMGKQDAKIRRQLGRYILNEVETLCGGQQRRVICDLDQTLTYALSTMCAATAPEIIIRVMSNRLGECLAELARTPQKNKADEVLYRVHSFAVVLSLIPRTRLETCMERILALLPTLMKFFVRVATKSCEDTSWTEAYGGSILQAHGVWFVGRRLEAADETELPRNFELPSTARTAPGDLVGSNFGQIETAFAHIVTAVMGKCTPDNGRSLVEQLLRQVDFKIQPGIFADGAGISVDNLVAARLFLAAYLQLMESWKHIAVVSTYGMVQDFAVTACRLAARDAFMQHRGMSPAQDSPHKRRRARNYLSSEQTVGWLELGAPALIGIGDAYHLLSFGDNIDSATKSQVAPVTEDLVSSVLEGFDVLACLPRVAGLASYSDVFPDEGHSSSELTKAWFLSVRHALLALLEFSLHSPPTATYVYGRVLDRIADCKAPEVKAALVRTLIQTWAGCKQAWTLVLPDTLKIMIELIDQSDAEVTALTKSWILIVEKVTGESLQARLAL